MIGGGGEYKSVEKWNTATIETSRNLYSLIRSTGMQEQN